MRIYYAPQGERFSEENVFDATPRGSVVIRKSELQKRGLGIGGDPNNLGDAEFSIIEEREERMKSYVNFPPLSGD